MDDNHKPLRPESQDTNANDTYPQSSNIGKAVIFCNAEFKSLEGVGNRDVALRDVDKLVVTLERIGFVVEKYIDTTTIDMHTKLIKVASEDHSDSQCFLCVISSHGYWNTYGTKKRGYLNTDVVYGTNGIIDLKTLIDSMKPSNAPTLKDKPKVFFLQHCRGDKLPANVEVTESGGQVVEAVKQKFPGSEIMALSETPEETGLSYLLPNKQDYFLHYATPQGYMSFKQRGVGTPFLKAWCEVLEETSGSREIEDLATRVNAKVCEQYISHMPTSVELGMHGRKQAPQIVSMLKKDFFLPIVTGT